MGALLLITEGSPNYGCVFRRRSDSTLCYAKGFWERGKPRSPRARKLTVREENSLFIQLVTQRNATLVALHHATHTTHAAHTASATS